MKQIYPDFSLFAKNLSIYSGIMSTNKKIGIIITIILPNVTDIASTEYYFL